MICGQNTQGTIAMVGMSKIRGGIREAAMQIEKRRRTEKILQNCQQWVLQTWGIGRKEKSNVKIYNVGSWETGK